MKSIYIISDVHGSYKTLLALIDKLPDKENSKICFVGDLVDRGSDSFLVIKYIMDNNLDCVLGNHELMFLKYAPLLKNDRQNRALAQWLFKNGGEETIKSYKNEEDFYSQLKFIKSLPLYKEYKDIKTQDGRYLVVSHSCVGKVWKLRDSKNKEEIEAFENHVLWSRYMNFDNKDIFNVYGHTIVSEPYIADYYADIDLGCYNKDKIPNPRLCALEFPSMKVFTQRNIE
jgi:serine/threonine protein phosphatase 1